MTDKKAQHVVIVGLGDTGLLTAVRLSKAFSVTAISTKPCMLSGQELGLRITQPKLWSEEYMLPFSAYKSLQGVRVIHGQVMAIDRDNNCVTLSPNNGSDYDLEYDVLLIASGVSNGFWRSANVQSMGVIERDLREHFQTVAAGRRIAVIGAGATGVSSAVNIARQFKDKEVHLFFSRDYILPDYHEKVREKLTHILTHAGVILHARHRAQLDEHQALDQLSSGSIAWTAQQPDFHADVILWAIGKSQPNNHFIPAKMLNENGFVNTSLQLQVDGCDNIFCVGDIADTDVNRCSARNAGYLIAAHNISCYLRGRTQSFKTFQPVNHRWGSILGLQKEGLTIYLASGKAFCIPRWLVQRILFPWVVRTLIYKGILKQRL